jgi:hypothetical protein
VRRCVTENGRRGKREVSKAEAPASAQPPAVKHRVGEARSGAGRERAKPSFEYFYPVP